MKKKTTIILISLIIVILVLLGIVFYRYEKTPKKVESIQSKESSNTKQEESLTIESVDYSNLVPITGNIKHHYVGVATNTKKDGVNLDMVELYIMDNNEIVVVQSYGEKSSVYYGSYAGSFEGDSFKIIYNPVLIGTDCKLSTYNHETIEIYENTDESIFFEELDANKEIIKLVDDRNTSKDAFDKLSCYKVDDLN